MKEVMLTVLLGISAVVCFLGASGAWATFKDEDPDYGGYLFDFMGAIVLTIAGLGNVYYIVYR